MSWMYCECQVWCFSLSSVERLSGSVWLSSYVLSLMSPSSLFKRNSTLLPGTEVIVWGRLGSPLVNILFLTKLLSLAPLSWDMDCLLTLWLRLPLVPLVTVASIWFSDLYHSWKKFLVPQPIYTHRKIIKAPLLHQSLGPRVFSLSLFPADSLERGDPSCSLSCPGF